MIKAVIFDMDGVLIDSEIIYLKALYTKLSAIYPKVTFEELFPLVGMDNQRCGEFLYRLTGSGKDPKEFEAEMKTVTGSSRIHYQEIMRPEVPRLLAEIKRSGRKLGLASSSPMRNIHTVLTQCEIIDFFEYIISGEELKESKPNPEIYLQAAKALECPPENCLVVEDSTYGIEAGLAAGMTVLALKETRFSFSQDKAHKIIDNLLEVLDYLL